MAECSADSRWKVSNNPLVMATRAAHAAISRAVRIEPASCLDPIRMILFPSPSPAVIAYAQAGHRPSSRTCWRLMTYPFWEIVAMGSETSVMQRVTPQFVQVKCG